jgi:hypothetical protein
LHQNCNVDEGYIPWRIFCVLHFSLSYKNEITVNHFRVGELAKQSQELDHKILLIGLLGLLCSGFVLIVRLLEGNLNQGPTISLFGGPISFILIQSKQMLDPNVKQFVVTRTRQLTQKWLPAPLGGQATLFRAHRVNIRVHPAQQPYSTED